MVALGAISAIMPLVLIERRSGHQLNLVSVPLLCADGENQMTRPLTFSLAPWQSATQDGADRIQEQEVDCAISDYTNAIESDPQ